MGWRVYPVGISFERSKCYMAENQHYSSKKYQKHTPPYRGYKQTNLQRNLSLIMEMHFT
jgi:hypothetical protein